jgi:hypothetical protein
MVGVREEIGLVFLMVNDFNKQSATQRDRFGGF